jgi:hypothetical protein
MVWFPFCFLTPSVMIWLPPCLLLNWNISFLYCEKIFAVPVHNSERSYQNYEHSCCYMRFITYEAFVCHKYGVCFSLQFKLTLFHLTVWQCQPEALSRPCMFWQYFSTHEQTVPWNINKTFLEVIQFVQGTWVVLHLLILCYILE